MVSFIYQKPPVTTLNKFLPIGGSSWCKFDKNSQYLIHDSKLGLVTMSGEYFFAEDYSLNNLLWKACRHFWRSESFHKTRRTTNLEYFRSLTSILLCLFFGLLDNTWYAYIFLFLKSLLSILFFWSWSLAYFEPFTTLII